jgi:hypothetical protein
MLGPAIYRGQDVTGLVFGGYEIVGLAGYKYNISGHKNHKLWKVKCIHCNRYFESQAQHVINSKYGCAECKGDQMSGTNSVHWKGGKHIPGFFIAKIKNKNLERRSKNIEFNLTVEYLDKLWESQGGRCAYTGEKLNFGRSKVNGNASLDRIDSSLGYIEGNVQFVHKDVNIMKWDLSEQRFLEICKKITKNRSK